MDYANQCHQSREFTHSITRCRSYQWKRVTAVVFSANTKPGHMSSDWQIVLKVFQLSSLEINTRLRLSVHFNDFRKIIIRWTMMALYTTTDHYKQPFNPYIEPWSLGLNVKNLNYRTFQTKYFFLSHLRPTQLTLYQSFRYLSVLHIHV